MTFSSHDPSPARGGLRRLTAALLLGTALVGVPVGGAMLLSAGATAQTAEPATIVENGAPASFAAIVRQVAPAVVNVSVTQSPGEVADMGEGPMEVPPGSPFEDFFRRFFEHGPQGRMMPPQGPGEMMHGQGSGFIIDPSGYIVTNNHVAGDASEITVTLNDGSQYDAELIGRDQKTDLALIKIDAGSDLPTVAWGDSDAAQVGDWVLAVGNPFGLGGTVTSGIISARGRDLHAGPFDDFLQVDASINRGNSGGPTFNLQGEVIGINTAIFSPSGGSVGIGFAIPANMARDIIAQLREDGSVDRGWIGVQIQGITPDLAAALGQDKPQGALVADVVEDGPAQVAGIRQGDLITKFDGKPVESLQDLPRLVAATAAGSTVDVEVLRGDEPVTLQVAVGDTPSDEQVATLDTKGHGAAMDESLGLSLAPLTPEMRDQYGVPEEIAGVLVTGVREDGPAREIGVGPGDVIVQVGSEAVSTPAEVAQGVEQAEAADRKAVMLLVNRQGDERFVAVRLPEA